MDEWSWLDEMTEALGEAPLDRAHIGAMLKLSREVAHGVDRKMAPVSTYVAGLHVARRRAEGATPGDALGEVEDAVARLIPPGSEAGLGTP